MGRFEGKASKMAERLEMLVKAFQGLPKFLDKVGMNLAKILSDEHFSSFINLAKEADT